MLNKPVVNCKYKCILHTLVVKLIATNHSIIDSFLYLTKVKQNDQKGCTIYVIYVNQQTPLSSFDFTIF